MKVKFAGREMELDIDERLNKQVRGRGVGTRTARTAQVTDQAGAPAPSLNTQVGCPLRQRVVADSGDLKVSIISISPLIIIYGKPIGKPRMSPRDKWAKRPACLRYWVWCDAARLSAFNKSDHKQTLDSPTRIQVVAHFYHKTRKGPHLLKPDGDNILKGVCDALFTNDQMLYDKHVKKYWTSGSDRVEVLIVKEA